MPKNSANREVINSCFGRLLEELGKDAGRRVIQIIVEELGGLTIHVPSWKTLETELRDEAIRLEFNGLNYMELAIRNKLTIRQVRRIVDGEKGGIP